MKKSNLKGWLYLLPAMIFLGAFLVYPLIDVLVYSFKEEYNFVTQNFVGIGLWNYEKVLRDPYFIQALKNTFILVSITVPLSTIIALIISMGLASIKSLRKLFQTVYFLPYVTNTLAVGMVFMILFDQTDHSLGLINAIVSVSRDVAIDFINAIIEFLNKVHFAVFFNDLIEFLGVVANVISGPIDFIDFINGPYWAKMLVMCVYTIWVVMPFKILILTGALASVKQDYYDAARVDGTSKMRTFMRITLPMISPTLFYLIITGFIGAFKAYSDAVALFGTDLNAAEMNTIVGYVYDMLYGEGGGWPSYASAAAIILFVIVFTITVINLLIRRKLVFSSKGGDK